MTADKKILDAYLTSELHDQLQQGHIADILAGLHEADLGEFATAEEVRAVFAKYGQ
jgi:predicted transcriptional regulator